MDNKILMVVVLLLALTNLYTVYLALRTGRRLDQQKIVEFYRGFYAARLLLQPGRPNYCRAVTWIALKDQVYQVDIPGWRWPLPRAYKPRH
ncbi:MAG: hypothetical protein KJ077_35715 [Anaerolineae bacterium]|nr:hypothetical protein [Anaerolineae bacterium]